jgi:hypothetical protein
VLKIRKLPARRHRVGVSGLRIKVWGPTSQEAQSRQGNGDRAEAEEVEQNIGRKRPMVQPGRVGMCRCQKHGTRQAERAIQISWWHSSKWIGRRKGLGKS